MGWKDILLYVALFIIGFLVVHIIINPTAPTEFIETIKEVVVPESSINEIYINNTDNTSQNNLNDQEPVEETLKLNVKDISNNILNLNNKTVSVRGKIIGLTNTLYGFMYLLGDNDGYYVLVRSEKRLLELDKTYTIEGVVNVKNGGGYILTD